MLLPAVRCSPSRFQALCCSHLSVHYTPPLEKGATHPLNQRSFPCHPDFELGALLRFMESKSQLAIGCYIQEWFIEWLDRTNDNFSNFRNTTMPLWSCTYPNLGIQDSMCVLKSSSTESKHQLSSTLTWHLVPKSPTFPTCIGRNNLYSYHYLGKWSKKLRWKPPCAPHSPPGQPMRNRAIRLTWRIKKLNFAWLPWLFCTPPPFEELL